MDVVGEEEPITVRVYTSNHQMLQAENALDLAEKLKDSDTPVRLLIVDSVTAHFRAENVGPLNFGGSAAEAEHTSAI